MLAEIRKNVRFNFTTNVVDAGFFGFGMGITSYVTVIPLFVSTMTDSSALIGLIAAMHTIGWQLPQLMTANRVARLRRYKPMVVLMTLNERIPFFALALVALLLPILGRELGLILTLLLVTWQAMGGGLTGTAWQSMIGKIIPANRRGTFYGTQSAAAALFGSVGAVLAGVILTAAEAPLSFAVCFLVTGFCMFISLIFLCLTREPESTAAREQARSRREVWSGIKTIVRGDGNLQLFIVARSTAQIAAVGFAFFTVYATQKHNMDPATAGIMTSVLLLTQTIANPIIGWLGDRTSHRVVYGIGALAAGGSAILALAAPSITWFYGVFALTGFASAIFWTTINALTYEFGSPEDRPYYIGLINTLIAPTAVLAPLVGGWLADSSGYDVTFAIAGLAGIATLILMVLVREPRKHYAQPTLTPAPSAEQA